MKVRNWNSLGAPQRRRYEQAGITRREYESGVSLTSARGHSKTPERPSRAKPGIHDEYIAKRVNRVNAIFQIKKSIWGARPKWNEKRSYQNVVRSPHDGHNRDKGELIRLLTYAQSWHTEPALHWGDETNDMVNAFYYH